MKAFFCFAVGFLEFIHCSSSHSLVAKIRSFARYLDELKLNYCNATKAVTPEEYDFPFRLLGWASQKCECGKFYPKKESTSNINSQLPVLKLKAFLPFLMDRVLCQPFRCSLLENFLLRCGGVIKLFCHRAVCDNVLSSIYS